MAVAAEGDHVHNRCGWGNPAGRTQERCVAEREHPAVLGSQPVAAARWGAHHRSHRLIQGGGWCGLRTIDEHTKLARASLEFPSALDELFHVNVAKMKVAVPAEVRTMLEAPVHELCREADAVYRAHSAQRQSDEPSRPGAKQPASGAGLAVRAAAMSAGLSPSQLREFEQHLRDHSPEVASLLGF